MKYSMQIAFDGGTYVLGLRTACLEGQVGDGGDQLLTIENVVG
jgi:hypothetical protein